MTYSKLDFIADQLRAAAPRADWNASGIDRSRELAELLNSVNVIDLRRLFLVRVSLNTAAYEFSAPIPKTAWQLEYEGNRFGYLGAPNKPERQLTLRDDEIGWSAAGHGAVSFKLSPTSGGFALIPVWGSTSDWGIVQDAFKFYAPFVLAFVLPAAGIQIGAAIGSAVVPSSFAAAYPALTAAIGHTALATAFNGGDIEAAVQNTVANYLTAGAAGQFGDAVSSLSGMDSLGVAAAAAARAVISGGDVGRAVITALAQRGMTVEPAPAPAAIERDTQMWDDDTGIIYPELSNSGSGDPYASFDFVPSVADSLPMSDLGFTPISMGFDNQGAQFDVPLTDYGAGFETDFWSAALPVPDISSQTQTVAMPELNFDLPELLPAIPQVTQTPQNVAVTTPPPSPFDNMSGAEIVNNISNVALQALKIAVVWDQIKSPVGTVAQQPMNNGAIRRVTDAGIIETRSPTGAVSVSRLPVNSPQSTVNGNIVNNNGDGSYTIIAPNGATSRRMYAPAQSSGPGMLSSFDFSNIPSGAIIGGVGLLAALFVLRGKR